MSDMPNETPEHDDTDMTRAEFEAAFATAEPVQLLSGDAAIPWGQTAQVGQNVGSGVTVRVLEPATGVPSIFWVVPGRSAATV